MYLPFLGPKTVTTANEIAYTMGASDDIKMKLGSGYKLFDMMGNAFTGDGSWAEMGDAMWDYTKAAVYDPSTLLSFSFRFSFCLQVYLIPQSYLFFDLYF